jgi:hypothetical protein
MKDKIEQLYISATIGEWDSAYFAERMMELMLPYIDVYKTNGKDYQDVQKASFNASESKVFFYKDGKYYEDFEYTKEVKSTKLKTGDT